MLVARNIEALMKQQGIDAAKLARVSGLNPTGIYDILKGKSRSPKVETISKIAIGLGVPIAIIFTEQPELAGSDIRDDLAVIFDQLSEDKRALLMQAARAWLPESAA